MFLLSIDLISAVMAGELARLTMEQVLFIMSLLSIDLSSAVMAGELARLTMEQVLLIK